MFLDFALLTEQQGELLDQIEFQVKQAGDYVEEANVDVHEAIEIQKSIRKKQWYVETRNFSSSSSVFCTVLAIRFWGNNFRWRTSKSLSAPWLIGPSFLPFCIATFQLDYSDCCRCNAGNSICDWNYLRWLLDSWCARNECNKWNLKAMGRIEELVQGIIDMWRHLERITASGNLKVTRGWETSYNFVGVSVYLCVVQLFPTYKQCTFDT